MLAEKQIDLSDYSASELLEQYTLWYRTGKPVRLGYPSRSAFANSIAENRETPNITDEQAMVVDAIISKMKSSKSKDVQQQTKVMLDYFEFGRYATAAKLNNITYSTARELTMKAQNHFAGLLGIC